MDLEKVLAQLHQELEQLDAAILSLERLQTEAPRRGRPPKALAEIRKSVKSKRGSTAGRSKPEPASGK